MARESPLIWATLVGSFALAALFTLAIARAAGGMIMGGVKVGATVGFLVWLGVDFLRYGGADHWTLTLTIVDPLLEIVRGGLTGAVIAIFLAQFDVAGPGAKAAM